MSTYLLIALVVLLALSPLFSMMPSRRQRQLADLRQAAASAGLYVKFDTRDDGDKLTVIYGCQRQRGDAPTVPGRAQREGEQWRAGVPSWPAERLSMLDELPAGVSEVREDAGGVAAVWDEQGERADVEQIARVLRRLLGRRY